MQDKAMQRSQKMQRVIHDKQPLIRVEREEWEMAAKITPEIPRSFFNTTNRNAYSAEEDVEDEDKEKIEHSGQDEEDDDLVYMGEHAQRDDDDDDDEEQLITVMQPRYTDVIATFGQQIEWMILSLHKTMLRLRKPMLNTSRFGSNRFVDT